MTNKELADWIIKCAPLILHKEANMLSRDELQDLCNFITGMLPAPSEEYYIFCTDEFIKEEWNEYWSK